MRDVKLEIYDAAGKLVQSVPGTKRKGINKVYWNLRWTPPKTATGGTKMDYGGFIAPMVLPGSYTLKLKVGDKEYTKAVQLVHDNTNKLFSEEDRKEQYDAAMKLYHMHEGLYALVNKISAEQKTIKSNMDSLVKPQSKKILKEYDTKLEELRSTLLATKHKSIFADERKLREEISELYGSVCGQECRPTNLQVGRVAVLADDLKKGEQGYEKLYAEYNNKTQALITTEKAKSKAATPRDSN